MKIARTVWLNLQELGGGPGKLIKSEKVNFMNYAGWLK